MAGPPPLALLAASDDTSAVRVASRLGRDFPDTRFIVVVPVPDVVNLAGLLAGLGPVSAETVLTRVDLPPDGLDPAVEIAVGVTGQDFLFTVPDLAEAIAWARAGALRDDLEGTGVLVTGAARTLAEARAILRRRRRRWPRRAPRRAATRPPAGPRGTRGSNAVPASRSIHPEPVSRSSGPR